MDYLSVIIAAVITFAATSITGVWLIPVLEKMNFKQTLYEAGDGPTWHKKKKGTPTMGGLLFVIGSFIGLVVALVFYIKEHEDSQYSKVIVSFLFAVSMGLIGLVDDWLKIIKKQNEGLTELQKTIFQFIVGAFYLWSLRQYGAGTQFWIPFIGYLDFKIFYYPICLIIIFASVNAVNFTDGIDGLCASVTGIVAIGFMIASLMLRSEFVILSGVLLGACAGFIVWNWNPAKVFMGDVGSLFLGGIVVAIAFGIGRPFLIAIFGVVYVWEALSVLIQRIYYKKTKKRLFKMTPIHHSFEISGYSEKKIVLLFSLVAVVGVIIGLMILRYDLNVIHRVK